MKNYDIIIIGAGPVGLCFSAALSGCGLKIAVIEKQSAQAIADPIYDGRDIAITHFSKQVLDQLGVWQHIPSDQISEIKKAKVLNGTSLYALEFNASDVGKKALGCLVSNHLIRKAAFENIKGLPDVDLITDVTTEEAHSNNLSAHIKLSNGEELDCQLLVASDGRFSKIRQKMGISAKMQDFGRLIIVCQMELETYHDNVAYECFHYGSTLAVLPLCGNKVSIIMTVYQHEADILMSMWVEQFNINIEQRFSSKYGKMILKGERYSYPLTSVYADRFIGQRFALIGDAAVGMHPVTAHGFNFGLAGMHTLSTEIKKAVKLGGSIASQSLLEHYQRTHKRKTKPLYLATNAIAKLFTNDEQPSKFVRDILLKIANRASPLKKMIISTLTKS